jgi:hypothetical protein
MEQFDHDVMLIGLLQAEVRDRAGNDADAPGDARAQLARRA